jgi:hypothetical protein
LNELSTEVTETEKAHIPTQNEKLPLPAATGRDNKTVTTVGFFHSLETGPVFWENQTKPVSFPKIDWFYYRARLILWKTQKPLLQSLLLRCITSSPPL